MPVRIAHLYCMHLSARYVWTYLFPSFTRAGASLGRQRVGSKLASYFKSTST